MRRPILPILSIVVLALASITAEQETVPKQPPQPVAPEQQRQGPPEGRGRGMRARPGEGREPEFPAPSITEYKPRSTLVVPQHPVPRARYPVIDIHGHPPALTSAETIDRVVAAMDSLNLRLMVNASGSSGDRLKQQVDAVAGSTHKDRFVMFTSVDWSSVGPGFGQRAVQQLEADVKTGAAGLGEIGKGLGMRVRKPDGTRLKLDDPELDPVWDACARLNIPVFIHTGDPAEFFNPIDYSNERWLEMALFSDRRYFDRSRYPSFEELMGERDRMLAKHPKTTFILAHLGWHANDLARLAAMMDKMPNLYGEVGAVLYDLGRQPRFAHDFLVKYQDRVLFGKDSFQPDEYPYYWRTFETADEYFDYYRNYHAFWKLYGLNLPDEVLKKLYYKNALKLVRGISPAGFPR
jgi:predicted TIM-barrel fold metal-dependent hydrolase